MLDEKKERSGCVIIITLFCFEVIIFLVIAKEIYTYNLLLKIYLEYLTKSEISILQLHIIILKYYLLL